MPRSLKKGPYVPEHLIGKIQKAEASGDKRVIMTWARGAMIVPDMVGHTIGVHNGRAHLPIYISEHMVGHKLGEFAPTRTYKGHAGTKEGKRK